VKRALFLGLCALTQLTALGNCGDFEVTVDYLYWKPANFAMDLGSTVGKTVGDRIFTNRPVVDPTYNSGVRGEAWWKPTCSPVSLMGRYSWVESRHAKTFLAPPVFSTPIEVQFIYHAAEVYAHYLLYCSNCLRVASLVGGRFLYTAFNSEQSNLVEGELSQLTRGHVRLAGGGASAGIAITWNVWRCLEAFAEGHFGLIYGSNMQAGESVTFGATANTRVPFSFQTWTREVDARLGGRYSMSCGCTTFGLELGWEARAYLDFPRWSSLAPGVIPSEIVNLGKSVGGPFIGLSARF
jgi:Legionella pneumophila major outer membrane protein precursor